MELGELCRKTLDVFECKSVSELGGKLYDAVINSDAVKMTTFCDIVGDLKIDWLQKIFQYYQADRQEKKQDYTPKSIAKLCAELTETGGKTVYDICAGSGALTIQKWVRNPDKQFICEELDALAEQYDAEQKQGYCERQEKRYSRMSEYSLDPDNQRMYGARAKQWGAKAQEYEQAVKSFGTVEKSGESGIIDTKEVQNMSIRSIDAPIEQRNTGKGNPNAVLTFGIELNYRQKHLLELLSGFDSRVTVPKKSVSMTDLSALTAYTGDEFALFTKGNERLIIRGNAVSVKIDIEQAKQMAEQGYRWSGHTHPGVDFNCLFASDGDKFVLEQFKQSTSVIYNSKGQFSTFEKE